MNSLSGTGEELRRPRVLWRTRVFALLENPWFRLLVLLVEGSAFAIGIWALISSLDQQRVAQESFTDQRIGSSWQILANQGPGSTGKQYALKTILTLEHQLMGVDLSCQASGKKEVGTGFCLSKPDLRNLRLDAIPNDHPGVSYAFTLQEIDFSDATMDQSTFSDALLQKINFTGVSMLAGRFNNVTLKNINFTDAVIWQSVFQESEMIGADFTNADISNTDMSGLDLKGAVNISGTIFCNGLISDGCETKLPPKLAAMAFYYSDNPPVKLDMLTNEAIHSCPNLSGPEGYVPVACLTPAASQADMDQLKALYGVQR